MDAITWVERLVRIDTTSRKPNLGLIEEVRDYLVGCGITPCLTYDQSRGKANLFATLSDAEGRTHGGLVLSGHTDVVPTDGQAWDTDPFQPVVKEGRLYGRGTCDMKGFIGTVLAQIPHVPRDRLRTPLHIALSYDEEVGCRGAPAMIEEFVRRGIQPAGCVVGEPTQMAPVVGHKGINIFRCSVHGRAAHSALTPSAVNAIDYAARLILFIRELADRLEEGASHDASFDVPFTTASTGLITGGTAANIVPATCEFVFEYRQLPGTDAAALFEQIRAYAHEKLVPEMRRRYPDAGIAFEKIASAPAFEAAVDASVTKLVRRLTRGDAAQKVAYATEAGQFQAAGVPSIVCGPGSIEQAHKANEFVSLEQLALCEGFVRALLLNAESGDY